MYMQFCGYALGTQPRPRSTVEVMHNGCYKTEVPGSILSLPVYFVKCPFYLLKMWIPSKKYRLFYTVSNVAIFD